MFHTSCRMPRHRASELRILGSTNDIANLLSKIVVVVRQGKGKKDRYVPIGERATAWLKKYMAEARPQLALEPDAASDESAGFCACRSCPESNAPPAPPGHRPVDAVQELAELEGAMAGMHVPQHASTLYFQGREQRGGAMPQVIMRAPLGLPRTHGQQWLRTVQRLDLRLFIGAQHQRLVGRMQVQAPTTSRTFSMNSGSLESWNVSARCGCKANARQMRLTALWLKPLRWAMERVDQWVASGGRFSRVNVSTRERELEVQRHRDDGEDRHDAGEEHQHPDHPARPAPAGIAHPAAAREGCLWVVAAHSTGRRREAPAAPGRARSVSL